MSIERVKEYLRQYNKEDAVMEFSTSSATVELAAGTLGVIPARIAKSLAFKAETACILIITAGDTKIDNKKFKEEFLIKAKMLSADVDAGFDPIYANVSEKNNAAHLGRGIGLNKYTGARGKSGASEAPAEFVAEIRKVFDAVGARYQSCELGQVDKGGGGTIALTLANRGMEVVDIGVPVMGMHSPYEITSKFDIYQAYKGYKAFYN